MWPVILELGPIKLYSFGLMAALAFLYGSHLLRIEMQRRGFAEDAWSNYSVLALLGGFLGARINYLVTHLEDLRLDWRGALFSGSGLVWYGGVLGGVLLTWLLSVRRKHHFGTLADAFAPSLAAAYMLGRVGCFISADGDYGPPSNVPWAMAFPNGIVPTIERVHPTPVYEVLLTLPILFLLWRTRLRDWPRWKQFGLYLGLSGIERFVIEYWRTNEPWLLGLTTPQLVSLGLIVVGSMLFLRPRSRGAAS